MAKICTNDCDIYVGIPFCNGRCYYCSFVSADINKSDKFIEPYINALTAEIAALKGIISKRNLNIRSVYIGGGTPSSLPLNFIEKILESIEFLLKNNRSLEYTFEAGRPDSIDENLLQLLKKYKISRISINPQTANDETLKRIGRKHKFEDVKKAFKIAKDFGFIINADIIAGLEGEGLGDFKNTVDKVWELSPDNITVHTLCLKKGSELKNNLLQDKLKQCDNKCLESDSSSNELNQGFEFNNVVINNICKPCDKCIREIETADGVIASDENTGDLYVFENNGLDLRVPDKRLNLKTAKEINLYLRNKFNSILGQNDEGANDKVCKMLEFAQNKFMSNDYNPYYIYRQKYSAENLENVGYCRSNNICLYNVDNMDDTVSVLACGANAVTKQVIIEKNAIERYAAPKDIRTYIEKIGEIVSKKASLFD